jgi:uncharacterized protein YjbI with pentapeptide repeats
MHSRDASKSNESFHEEFERVLGDAGEGWADFTGFVFPTSNYLNRVFAASCCFNQAAFVQDANFNYATFLGDAHFCSVAFEGKAQFVQAKFMKDALFGSTKFGEWAHFTSAVFSQVADFRSSVFKKRADLLFVLFAQSADFGYAMFNERADFRSARFAQDADFDFITFGQDANFTDVMFQGAVRFGEIRSSSGNIPGVSFVDAKFIKPEATIFYQTRLDKALFLNSDVSKVNFSAVQWCRRSRNGKWMVFDEVVPLERRDSGPQSPLVPARGDPNPRKYVLIAETYQQLKRNYDNKADYWTAGHFHYGEMEMKRLYSGSTIKWVRWLHSNLGLIAWYKYASSYGESYVRPMIWLAAILLLFTLIYPVAGLSIQSEVKCPAEQTATYSHPSGQCSHQGNVLQSRIELVGHSFMTTLYVAAFQKDLVYKPTYPWGRLFGLLEALLTSTAAALFLLAVRRQFRR